MNSQFVNFAHHLASAVNKQSQGDVIFLDFCKAFDKVSDPKLIMKLKAILRHDLLEVWIESCSSSRRQFVEYNNSITSLLSVESGVPEGSVLGPILFLMFLNDLVKDISVNTKLYAGEINCPGDQTQLNSYSDLMVFWCNKWQMSLNEEKAISMTLLKKQDHGHTTTE